MRRILRWALPAPCSYLEGPNPSLHPMRARLTRLANRPKLRRRALLAAVVLLFGWIALFDSHSLWRRAGYHREAARLAEENEKLRAEIEVLEARLKTPLSDENVEKVAREQYGMRRPGETVYRVKAAE